MANTYVYNQSGGSGVLGVMTGYVDCDGSTDLQVELGFIPTRVECFIVTDPEGTPAQGEGYLWSISLDSAGAYVDNTIAIATTGARTVAGASIQVFEGLEEDPGTPTPAIAPGFTLPASLVTNTDRLYWSAFR